MISPFEYVTVLISIVLSLGITQILTSLTLLVKKRTKVISYWPHSLWVLFILFLHIQEWWVMYSLRTFEPWRLPVFLFIMLYPIALFVLAKLLFPNKIKGKLIDLKAFYYENYPLIFIMIVISAILSVLYNLFVLDFQLYEQFLQISMIVVFSTILIKKYSFEWLHKAIAILVTAISVISVIIEWDIWLIS